MTDKIRVLLVEPNKEPKQVKIPHTLKELQNAVGGLIEFVQLDYNTDLICNEEGKILNLELNRVLGNDIIAGIFIIVGQRYGKTISLSRKQIKKYKERFRLANNREIIEYVKYFIDGSSDLIRCNAVGIDKN